MGTHAGGGTYWLSTHPGAKSEMRRQQELMSMDRTLLPSKVFALRRRITSSIRGCIQPLLLGVDSLGGSIPSFLGVMVSTGVDGGMNEPGVPVEGCPVESEDEVRAVEDISEAFVRRGAARFNSVFCQKVVCCCG
jgi:hypothetical protein